MIQDFNGRKQPDGPGADEETKCEALCAQTFSDPKSPIVTATVLTALPGPAPCSEILWASDIPWIHHRFLADSGRASGDREMKGQRTGRTEGDSEGWLGQRP